MNERERDERDERDKLRTKQYRSKVTENFKNDLKIHQYEMIKCNKNLHFSLPLTH